MTRTEIMRISTKIERMIREENIRKIKMESLRRTAKGIKSKQKIANITRI